MLKTSKVIQKEDKIYTIEAFHKDSECLRNCQSEQ